MAGFFFLLLLLFFPCSSADVTTTMRRGIVHRVFFSREIKAREGYQHVDKMKRREGAGKIFPDFY